MAFNTWRPGSFALDNFVLEWPAGPASPLPRVSNSTSTSTPRGHAALLPHRSSIHAQKEGGPVASSPDRDSHDAPPSLSWEECGLDVRIASALADLECPRPNLLQRHVVESMLSLHHLDLPIASSSSLSPPPSKSTRSSSSRTGATTAVLASSLHSIPDSSEHVSVLVVTTTPQRADDLAQRLQQVGGNELGVRVRTCHEQTDFSSDLTALRGDVGSDRRPHVVVATLGRCVTLMTHYSSLSLSSLSLLILDLSTLPSSTWLTSHHVVADFRQVLVNVKSNVQIVVRADSAKYPSSPVGKLVGCHQEDSSRTNLRAIDEAERLWQESESTTEAEQEEEEEKLRRDDELRQVKRLQKKEVVDGSSNQSREDRVGQDWKKVVEEFEFSGLVPEDFLAVKRDKEEKVFTWADKVDAALRSLPQDSPPLQSNRLLRSRV